MFSLRFILFTILKSFIILLFLLFGRTLQPNAETVAGQGASGISTRAFLLVCSSFISTHSFAYFSPTVSFLVVLRKDGTPKWKRCLFSYDRCTSLFDAELLGPRDSYLHRLEQKLEEVSVPSERTAKDIHSANVRHIVCSLLFCLSHTAARKSWNS